MPSSELDESEGKGVVNDWGDSARSGEATLFIFEHLLPGGIVAGGGEELQVCSLCAMSVSIFE